MKKIPLADAFKLLQNCSAVVVEDHVVYPGLAVLEGYDENQFLHLSWKEDNQGYSVTFAEGENQEVSLSGSDLFLVDMEGEEVQVTLLAPMTLE